MLSAANIIVLSGLLIGLVYGAVGLLSGFCLLSSLRGWWAEGDGRLVRTYALAIGVVRKDEPYEGHSNSKVEIINASVTDVAARVRELTNGKGADIVFNTVGDPYFQAAHKSLALRGRQILIAAVDRIVQFNILEFYRGQHTYVGIDTLGLSSIATGAVLAELGPGFASGHLKPFPIRDSAIYPLEQARAAFIAVAGSSRDRVILRPA